MRPSRVAAILAVSVLVTSCGYLRMPLILRSHPVLRDDTPFQLTHQMLERLDRVDLDAFVVDCLARSERAWKAGDRSEAHRLATRCLDVDPDHIRAKIIVEAASSAERQLRNLVSRIEELIDEGQYQRALDLLEPCVDDPRGRVSTSVTKRQLVERAWFDLRYTFDRRDVPGGGASMTRVLGDAAKFVARHEFLLRRVELDLDDEIRDWEARLAIRHASDRARSLADSLERVASFRRAFECRRSALLLDSTDELLRHEMFAARQRWIESSLEKMNRALAHQDWSTAHRHVAPLIQHVTRDDPGLKGTLDLLQTKHVDELAEEAESFLANDLPGCALLTTLEAISVADDSNSALGSLLARCRERVESRPLVSVDTEQHPDGDLYLVPLVVVSSAAPEYSETRSIQDEHSSVGMRPCGTQWKSSPGHEADRRSRRELSVQLHELDLRLKRLDDFERAAVERRYEMIESKLKRIDTRILAHDGGRRVTAWKVDSVESEKHSVSAELTVSVTILRRGHEWETVCVARELSADDVSVNADPARDIAGEVATLPSESGCRLALEEELDDELAFILDDERRRVADRCLQVAMASADDGEILVATELLVRLLVNERVSTEQRVMAEIKLVEWSRRSATAAAQLARTLQAESGTE